MQLVFVTVIAFICEGVDSTLGMGYGTSLTPILWLMGFEPMQIVPCVLLSEFVTGITAAGFHHRARNADFRPGSADGKVAIVLSLFSVVGVVAAILVVTNVPQDVLKLIISLIVISMAVLILFAPRLKPQFSWKKITILGAVASLSKGLTGGGYGALVTGGSCCPGSGSRMPSPSHRLLKALRVWRGWFSISFLQKRGTGRWRRGSWSAPYCRRLLQHCRLRSFLREPPSSPWAGQSCCSDVSRWEREYCEEARFA